MLYYYRENNTISVWNNGKGIPVVIHKEENMYVPTMIFGHLLTSSNYDDEEEKVTGGRNGYGAKLCNIFSHRFTVETATKEYKKCLKQVRYINISQSLVLLICYNFLFFYRRGAIIWVKLAILKLKNISERISRRLHFRRT